MLAAGDEVGLLVAGVAVAFGGERPFLQAAFDAGGLGLHLAEGGAGVGGLALGVAALVVLGFEGGGQVGELALQGGGARVSVWASSALGGFELGLDFGEFALEGERALRARAAAGDGDVVEGFAGGREEEGLRVRERRASGRCRSRGRRSRRGAWGG